MTQNNSLTQNQTLPNAKFLLTIQGISIVLGLFYNYLFYEKTIGISFFIYINLILIVGFFLAKNFQIKITKFILIPTIPLLFFSAMVFVRSSSLLTILNYSISAYLLLMMAFSLAKPKIINYFFWDYLSILKLPLSFAKSNLNAITDSIQIFSNIKKYQNTAQILRGILITLPILIVFLFLFSSADLVFNKYCVAIIDALFSVEIFIKLYFVIIVALVFIGVFYYSFQEHNEIFVADQFKTKSSNHNIIETLILFGSINALFLAFLIVQFKYLFFGGDNASVQGFTYAEYARSGFFQLITIAVISFFLIRFTEKTSLQNSGEYSRAFKFMGGALIVQVIVVMASAFKRLALYEDAYGFTELRLYSHIFTVLLAVGFVLLLYKLLVNHREDRFAFGVFLSVVATLAMINLINPDSFIAKKNIERFVSSGKLDIDHLTRSLSEDSVPEAIQAMNLLSTDELSKGRIAAILYKKQQTLTINTNWQSIRLSGLLAKELLDPIEDNLNKDSVGFSGH